MNQSSRREDSNGIVLDPIYIQTSYGEDFELNWPIWHRLPHNERKSIANQHGFANIGDFEESVILTQTLRQGETTSSESVVRRGVDPDTDTRISSGSYSMISSGTLIGNESIQRSLSHAHNRNDVPMNHLSNQFQQKASLSTASASKTKSISKLYTEISSSEEEEEEEEKTQIHRIPILTTDVNLHVRNNNKDPQTDLLDNHHFISNGGLIMMLPEDLIIHHIMIFLSTEYFALCSLVSPHWKHFTRSEPAYQEICKRCYMNQSKRKTLHVARFGGSYRTMLEKRWRVKVGCGVYVLKCTKIKQIQRDMWTEIPIGAILESTYYRYLYFYEDGRVLYSLTSKAPHEIIPTFRKMNAIRDPFAVIAGQGHCSIVYGTYEIQKDCVIVNVRHPWHYVRMHLKVMEEGDIGPGRFWELKLVKHMSSVKNDFDEYWSRDLVEYNVPDEHFRFLRDWKL